MKIKTRNLGLSAVLVMLFIGIIGIANAQEALPKGGDSFETAVEIKPGSYEGGAMKKGEAEFFYISLRPGQEIKIESIVKALSDSVGSGNIDLHDENKKELASESETVEGGEQATISPISWLLNSDKDSYKYYIKRYCSWVEIAGHSLDLSITDRFDVDSQTDVGNTFEKAMKITKGEYKGYLSGKKGNDIKDLYKIAVKKGTKLTVRLTPSEEASPELKLYNSSRELIESERAPNPGAIITVSTSIAKSEDVFIELGGDQWHSKDIVPYTLNVETEEDVVVEEEEEILPEEEVPVEEIYPGIYPKEAEEAVEVVKKGFRWALIMGIVGVIVVIIIIVLVVYFLTRKKKK